MTLDFRDVFKQVQVVQSELWFLAGFSMNGYFSHHTVLFGGHLFGAEWRL